METELGGPSREGGGQRGGGQRLVAAVHLTVVTGAKVGTCMRPLTSKYEETQEQEPLHVDQSLE